MVLLQKTKFPSTIYYRLGILFIIAIAIAVTMHIQKQNPFTYSFLVNSKNQSNLTQSIRQTRNTACIVYLEHISGRLGNKLFMVASAYGLARLHSCHLYLTPAIINEMKLVFIFDLSPVLISTNMLNSIINNTATPITTTMKSVGCQYIPELKRPNAISLGHIFELRGYWQSYLHFHKHSYELQNRIFVAKQLVIEKVSKLFINIYEQQFKFKPQFSLNNHQLFKKQLSESKWTTWIGIHVRRSDFVHLNFSSSEQYLYFAVKYYRKRYPNASFIVASDDKRYCKNLFHNQTNVFITPESFSEGDDLIALSFCQHSIITGGTFGWWAAYLANGYVIHDKVYPSGCVRREHYYPPWFLIDGYVRAYQNSANILR
ncbi:unnamed protein product [Rotaria magnacalcarata]|uniref:L-Fucosyltransferase n=1 Tax=Rotaria magnacalcarata TaxID=392030 RepID=A0A815MRP7_9BILA|nr:unnamed protein product [Rotaria magnacalcarata]CAF2076142.1 unnamed protein product [Rotaria magnacalcarata]CAF4148918.1 unnamed protein product [Rotaria magnacalcarata]